MIYILDKTNGELVKSEIVSIKGTTSPLKKDGWSFNWRSLSNKENGQSYILRTLDSPSQIQGALHLKFEYDMLVMDALEVAPHNVGQQNKRYDYVAGCLIAFACRESLKLSGNYKGFLTFVSKTNLINWYTEKYGAELALGQRMFIDFENGEKLIKKYLQRTKTI
ncbi:MAG: hypothetical protein ACI9V1_002808 [Spirosomataceae bacterium]|jgi:hypothetical protein